jgi:uncharacterized repeat protein (TIGR01451 family)
MSGIDRISLRSVAILTSVVLLTAGGLVFAASNLTGTGSVTVTAPIVSAVFVSGSVGTQGCTISNNGNTLSCPGATIQQGDTATLTFQVKNTGTIEINLGIQVTPVNPSVLSVEPGPQGTTTLAVGSVGTYTYSLIGIGTGNSGFTISISPVPLPPQA